MNRFLAGKTYLSLIYNLSSYPNLLFTCVKSTEIAKYFITVTLRKDYHGTTLLEISDNIHVTPPHTQKRAHAINTRANIPLNTFV